MRFTKIGYSRYIYAVIACFLLLWACGRPQEKGVLFKANEDIFAQDTTGNFGEGWHALEKSNSSSVKWRWMDQESQFALNYPAKTTTKISMTLHSFFKPRTCKISINNKEVFANLIPSNTDTTITFDAELSQGTNQIKIISLDGSQAPSEIPGLKNKDTRKLSFAIKSVNIGNKR